jgi:hypothetical protein
MASGTALKGGVKSSVLKRDRDRETYTRDRAGSGLLQYMTRNRAGSGLIQYMTRNRAGSELKTHPVLEHWLREEEVEPSFLKPF